MTTIVDRTTVELLPDRIRDSAYSVLCSVIIDLFSVKKPVPDRLVPASSMKMKKINKN